jgi:hypothetical protein
MNGATLTLRDWEEIPDDSEQIDFAWESLVSAMLNGTDKVPPLRSVTGRGLLGPSTLLWDIIGSKPITQIKIGDYIRDGFSFTKVLGIYTDKASVPIAGPNDSIWYFNKIWTHYRGRGNGKEVVHPGYHLITSSGSFTIGFDKEKILVRDFTEVGANRIHETYPFIKSII